MKNLNLFRKSARGSEGSTLASAVVRPSFDCRSTVVKHLAFMLLFLLGSLNVWGEEVTFSFTSKDNLLGWSADPIPGSCETSNLARGLAWSKSAMSMTYTLSEYGISHVKIIASSNNANNYVLSVNNGTGQSIPKENNKEYDFDVNVSAGGAVTISTTYDNKGKSFWIKSITFTKASGVSSKPTVNVSPASWDFGTVHASAEASKVFSVSGSNLTAGNLTLTVPDGFSVDPSSIAVDGTLAATNVTVSKNTSTEDDYAGNLSITGGGLASAKTVGLTMTVDADPEPTGTFSLYNGAIKEGDYVLVGYSTSAQKYYAMNSTVTSNQYLGITEVSIDANDQIVDPDASLVWTIEQSTNGYYIKQGSAYLDDNATSNKNYAQTVAEPTTTSEWTFAYDNTWTITNYGTETTKKTLSFNISASRVACYTAIQSGNTCFYLYKKVDGAVKPSAGLAFDAAQKLAKVAGTLTAPNLSTADGFDGTVTYASSDEAVVKVNASTGAITEIVAVGKAVITAHSDETENFREGSASYTIFVAEQAGTNEDPLTEASAKALIDNGCTLNVNVKGTVGVVGSLNTTYGSISLTLTDGFQFYGMLNTSGEQFTENPFVVGDVVTAVGNLKKHNTTTYELDLNCQLVERIPFAGSKTSIANTKETAYTIAQALAYAADPTTYDLTDHVYIAGVVYQVNSFNSTNGTYNIYIKDAGTSEDDGKFEFYKCSGLYAVGGTPAQFAEGDVQIGDEVIGYGVMTYFSGGSIWEFGQPNQLVALNRPTVPVTSINLTESTATVEEGKTVTLHASVLPNNATDQDIVWTVVSGDTYASVDNGVVTGIAAGEAVIRAASHEDASIHEECTVTVTEPAPLSPWATTYTSNVTLTAGTGAQAAKVRFTADGEQYDAVKAGTGKAGGSITVTVPAQATKLHLHVAGWTGENPTISITAPDGVTVSPASISATADAGISSNSPFTLENDPVGQYFALSLSGNTEEIELTFAVDGGNKRFVLFGVNQEGGSVPVLDRIEISGDLTNKSGYKAGDALDLDGLTVMATYTLGGTPQTPVDITDDAELAWSYDPLVENQTSVTITASYKGQTDDITINDLDPVASADPLIITDPTTYLNWGTIIKDAPAPTKTITVTLQNVTAATAALGGTNPTAFTIDDTEIADGDVITVSVASTATAGVYSAKVILTDNAGFAPNKEINLSLTIEDAETPVSTTSKWVAATDADLVDGAEVLITGVKEDVVYAMSVKSNNGNNRTAVAGTLDEGIFTPGENTMSFFLEANGDNFYIKTSNDKYLYNASTSGNSYLRTKDNNEDASWTIELSEGNAVITSVENTNRTLMRFNLNGQNSPLFNCYASGQQPVQLYVPKPAPTPAYTDVRTGLTPNHYYTICYPKAMTDIQGATLWSFVGKDANFAYLVQETATTIEAGKPYIMYATASTVQAVLSGDDAAASSNNGLYGTLSSMDQDALNTAATAAGNDLYLVIGDELRRATGAGTGGNSLAAQRAYVVVAEITGGAPALMPGRQVRSMGLPKDTPTGIDNAEASEKPVKKLVNGQLFILRGEKMYNANGQLVK